MTAVVARCAQGGLFETRWLPLVSLRAVRLGSRRWQRCPVHRHWEMISKVDPDTVTPAMRTEAARYPAGRIP